MIRFGLRPRHWPDIRDAIRAVDVVLIGGGELLQETPSLFADHIAAVAREARRAGKRFGLLACGVEPCVKLRSRRLVAPVLERADMITVRDNASRDNLSAWAPQLDLHRVRVAPDPGVLACRLFPPVEGETGHMLGLNVIAYTSVARRDAIRCGPQEYAHWYSELARSVRRVTGMPVALFSNGAIADHRFAEALHRALRDPEVSLGERPGSVDALARQIRTMKGVVASRLHAGLMALSYGIPCLAVSWSQKFDVLIPGAAQTDRLFRLTVSPVECIAEALGAAMKGDSNAGIGRRLADGALEHVDAVRAMVA